MEQERTGNQVLTIYASNLNASFYNATAEAMRENGLGNVTVTELYQQEWDPKWRRYIGDSFRYKIEFDSSESQRVFKLLNKEALVHVSPTEDPFEARKLGIEQIRKTAKQIKEGTLPPAPEV